MWTPLYAFAAIAFHQRAATATFTQRIDSSTPRSSWQRRDEMSDKLRPYCEECATFSCKHNAEYIDELIAKLQLVTDAANEMKRIRQTDLSTCQGMVDRAEQMRHNAEKLSALFQEENAMLNAQVKRLEDSRFALAVAHTEDILTIERLTAKESKTAQHPLA
jgi:hypothetical protein